MNQQEVDRLFHENSHEDEAYTNGAMLPHGFAQERESRLARLAEGALRDHSADRHAAVVHALQVIQSALSQSSHEQARQSDVPAGYVQVPKEPTLDMYYAACKAYCAWEVQCAAEERAGREFSQPSFTHSDVYRAMIAAAPENAR